MNVTEKEALLKRLKNPDNGIRPVQIIHHGFPRTQAEIEAFLDHAVEIGMGGFCVNMDDADGYLREDSAVWHSLTEFIDAALQRELSIWIYDEKGYPSGAANDLVLKALPNAQVKGLVCGKLDTDGGEGEWEHAARYAAAYPIQDGILLKSRAISLESEEGRIRWKLPAGKWRILAFETRPINYLTENEVPYVDLMRSDVVQKFIEVTHERYRKHLGDERIGKITAFFTDEPGLPVHGCSRFFEETDAVCAWTEEMDLLLPGFEENYVDLFFDTDGDFTESRKIWWQIASRLFTENYFGKIAAWCERYGTGMTGHLYGEETLSMQIGLNADFFSMMRRMQMPGVDRLYCDVPRDVIAEKTASSAAHFNGKSMVMSESSFHLEYNWWKIPEKATHKNRINSAYYQAQLGVTYAASYFHYPDPDRTDYEYKAARAGLFTSFGTHRTDVLVLIPMTAAYERFAVPDHKYWNVGPCIEAPYQGESMRNLELIYGNALNKLEDMHYDFDLIDEAGLTECFVKSERICTGYEAFSTLVVFDSGTLTEKTQMKLKEFLDAGGHITFVKTDLPTKWAAILTDAYPGQTRYTDANDIGQSVYAKPVLDISGNIDGIRVKKCVKDDMELYFIHNRRPEERRIRIDLVGELTLCSMNMDVQEFSSVRTFELCIPPMDARMIIK